MSQWSPSPDDTSVHVETHPLWDHLIRSSSGWSCAWDGDYRVLLAHDSGLWVRFGPSTWARIGQGGPAAAQHVAHLMLHAVELGVTGRHTLTGTFAVAHNPDGTVSDVGGHTIALERYDRST
jgi:hypothetical protein